MNDNSKSNYTAAYESAYNTKILKSNLSDLNDAHILVTRDITVIKAPQTHIAFENCVPFTKCVTKIDEKTIDDAEDLVMPMYSVTEYSSICNRILF